MYENIIWQPHAIQLNFSVPLFDKGIYTVCTWLSLLGGGGGGGLGLEEQGKRKRKRKEGKTKPKIKDMERSNKNRKVCNMKEEAHEEKKKKKLNKVKKEAG